jgi:long-chain acyl-CoA synthetase
MRQNGAVTDGCYDAIVFKKMQALLGGNVRFMITASAPIEPDMKEILRICFCCTFF